MIAPGSDIDSLGERDLIHSQNKRHDLELWTEVDEQLSNYQSLDGGIVR
jgi:hypothetical protein